MGTANFYSHENGIFVVEGYTYDSVKADLVESGDYTEEEITDNMIYNAMNDWNEGYYCDFMKYILPDELKNKGYTLDSGKYWNEATVYNSTGKWVADLELRGGYYDGVQLIVETDMYEKFDGYYDTKADILEQATPHHKRLLKAIEKMTTRLIVSARFSNGETWYQTA